MDSSVIRQPTSEELQKLPSRQRNAAKVEQHLTAFSLHLRGLSDRAVQEELGLRHLRSAQHSIRRGEAIAKELGLDTDRVRLKVAAWFEELADLSMRTLRDQFANGQVVEFIDEEGKSSYRRNKHIDPRLAGEVGRGLVRMAQFFQLMDQPVEINQATTNVVLGAPLDGNAFMAQWSQPQAVDVSAMPADSSEVPQTSAQDCKGHLVDTNQSTKSPAPPE